MKIAMICFTQNGATVCRRIADGLTEKGHSCIVAAKGAFAQAGDLPVLTVSLAEWTAQAFAAQEALVFVGACGIAVRAVAPLLKDKAQDPAVMVVDEKGQFVISLLSGHLGGANDWTREIADMLKATPVITTATDLNQQFAVDSWAKENRLRITSLKAAKEISAAVLRKEPIGVSSDFPLSGQLPENWQLVEEGKANPDYGVRISVNASGDIWGELGAEMGRDSADRNGASFAKTTLHLVPAVITVGIGCRRNTAFADLLAYFLRMLKEQNLVLAAVEQICSIDLKKDEPALLQLAETLEVPLLFFSAEELADVQGNFTPSDFVASVTGVDNVCERAAVRGSGGELIMKKQAGNGITAAMAIRKEEYQWN